MRYDNEQETASAITAVMDYVKHTPIAAIPAEHWQAFGDWLVEAGREAHRKAEQSKKHNPTR